MPADPALEYRYQQTYNRFRLAVSTQLANLWDLVGGVNDQAEEEFTTRATALALGARRSADTLVSGYLTEAARLAGVTPTPTTAPDVSILRGVPIPDLYRRPIVTARSEVAELGDFERARTIARQRVRALAEADVMLTQRASITHRGGQLGIVGYQRTLTGESCKFCATVSTRRYRIEELMPVHNHCDCGVAAIIGDRDPGEVINRERLERLKRQGPDYWKTRGFVDSDGNPVEPGDLAVATAVEEHGELGPVLVDPAHHFATT